MRTIAALILMFGLATCAIAQASAPIDIGSRRDLFVDRFLIDKLIDGAELRLHRPIDRGEVLAFDAPWEGPFCAYVTVIRAVADKYQMYYRGLANARGGDHDTQQVTCYAESNDGIRWTKPSLGLFPRSGHETTNILLADAAPV